MWCLSNAPSWRAADWLGSARSYSTLDLTKGYWQIPLSPYPKKRQSSQCRLDYTNLLHFHSGNSGLQLAFSCLMDRIFRPIMIGSGISSMCALSWDRYGLRDLQRTRRSVQLGIWRYGIWASTWAIGRCVPKIDKTAAKVAYPGPKNKRRWGPFEGLAEYYSRCIPNYSALTSPLTDLTKKEAPDPVQWTELYQQAEQVKGCPVPSPHLFTCEGREQFLKPESWAGRRLYGRGASQEIVLNFILVKKPNKSLVYSWSLTSSFYINMSRVTLGTYFDALMVM